ncbi:MAG: hypothetical protein ACK4MQ_08850 [Hyphomonas sp.]
MLIPSLLSAIALMASPAASVYQLDFYIQDQASRTVFMAAPGATTLPVLRICYDRPASSPTPSALRVNVTGQHQHLVPGECSFFSGEKIDLSVVSGRGSIRATVTLLR